MSKRIRSTSASPPQSWAAAGAHAAARSPSAKPARKITRHGGGAALTLSGLRTEAAGSIVISTVGSGCAGFFLCDRHSFSTMRRVPRANVRYDQPH